MVVEFVWMCAGLPKKLANEKDAATNSDAVGPPAGKVIPHNCPDDECARSMDSHAEV